MSSSVTTANPVLYTRLHQAAQIWLRALLSMAGLVFAGIVSILVGLNTPVNNAPLFTWVHQHPNGSLVSGGVLVAATLAALLIARGPLPSGNGHGPLLKRSWLVAHLLIPMAISTVSTVLFVSLLVVVLVRPPWCPAAICPPALVITNPHGIHDDNMELYFSALQSATYVVPGNPATYTLQNPPKDIGALRLDRPESNASPYRLVLGIHSLQRGEFGIIIEAVTLVVRDVPPTAYPLNVWDAGAPLDYHSNVFAVTYTNQPAGVVLPATYLTLPGGFVRLSPGEADEIDLQVTSKVPADLRFQVQVTYRVTNESQSHTLTLPHVFEVVFSLRSNWHVYAFQNGRLAPVQQ